MSKAPQNKISTLEITDWRGGLNTRMDARAIGDNESPYTLNMDVTAEGAIQTRFGYELVCTLPAGTRTYGCLPYYKTVPELITIIWDSLVEKSTITLSLDPTITYGNTFTPTAAVKSAGAVASTGTHAAQLYADSNTTRLSYASETGGNLVVVYFSRPIDQTNLTNANINAKLDPSGGHTWSPGAGLSWNTDGTILTVSGNTTVTIGDTFSPANLKDAAGNNVTASDATVEAPFTDPRITAVYGTGSGVGGAFQGFDTISMYWTTPMDKTTLLAANLNTVLGISSSHTLGTDTPVFKRLCVFGSDGHMYYITGSSTTPVDAGSYITQTSNDHYGQIQHMTATDTVRGAELNDLLVFGNGTANPVKYDGLNITNIGKYSIAAPNNIFETYGTAGATSGYKMYGAGNPISPSTLYYSTSGNPDDWDTASDAGATTVAIGDGTSITALKALEQNLFIFKTDRTYIGQAFQLPASGDYINAIKVLPNQLAAGCAASASIAVFNNDIIRLADPQTYGITSLGFQNNLFTQNQRNGTLSWKIQPTVRGINTTYMEKSSATYFQDKYILATPVGSVIENNSCFTYSITIGGQGYWQTWNDVPAAAFTIFRNDQNLSELYFASNLEPKLFKFNHTFSDAGNGYTRIWRSKIFTLGDRRLLKKFYKFIVRGAFSANCNDLKFRVFVDGVMQEYTINQNYIELNSNGETMGDNIVGDIVFGGSEIVSFNRFMYRDDFGLNVNLGREIYFEMENENAGAGWKVDYIGLDYEQEPSDNYPFALTSQPAPL